MTPGARGSSTVPALPRPAETIPMSQPPRPTYHALGAITDGFGAEAALATATVLLVAVAALFGWRAPETYRARGY